MKGVLEVVKDHPAQPAALRRDECHQAFDIGGRISCEVNAHHEDADHLDDQLNAAFEVRNHRSAQDPHQLVQRGSQYSWSGTLRHTPAKHWDATEQAIDTLVQLAQELGEVGDQIL